MKVVERNIVGEFINDHNLLLHSRYIYIYITQFIMLGAVVKSNKDTNHVFAR